MSTKQITNHSLRNIAIVATVIAMAFMFTATVRAQTVSTTELTILNGLTTAADAEMASDVYIGDVTTPIATNLKFGEFVELGTFSSGAAVNVRVFKTGEDPNTATPYIDANVDIATGLNSTLSLLFTESDASAMGVAVTASATTPPEAGTGWVEIQHLAGTGGLDVYIDGTSVFAGGVGLAGVGTIQQTAGSHTLTLVPTGQDISTAIYGPITFDVTADSKAIFYAVGDPAVTPDGFDVVARVLSDLSGAPATTSTTSADTSTTTSTVPSEIPTGDSALDGGFPLLLIIVVAGGAILVTAGVVGLRRS